MKIPTKKRSHFTRKSDHWETDVLKLGFWRILFYFNYTNYINIYQLYISIYQFLLIDRISEITILLAVLFLFSGLEFRARLACSHPAPSGGSTTWGYRLKKVLFGAGLAAHCETVGICQIISSHWVVLICS